ncbi:TnsD family Tn7-like transposition protein [Sutcliffiella horikoshii]|uniref:TnsD family Tn7-like transposition protein n=1 Tax=Sutcliffiella horikoshii TaxID=79883 RepID=UPI001CFE4ACB|nr:TnsD family Tn7-like transposition protein [Sutcliffiella horikoshii]
MNKLLFFPTPYPDEDFRSVVYRYHVRSGNSDFKQTKIELFNLNSEKVSTIPRNISFLLNKMPYGNFYNKEYILALTWFPFLRAFLPEDRLINVNEDIMYGKTGSYNYANRIDIQKHFPLVNKVINYCPICIKEDFEKYGEAYIHLHHQLSFINFCPLHHVNLIEKCLECGKYFTNKYASSLTIKPCCDYSCIKKVKIDTIFNFKLKLLSEVKYFKQYNRMDSQKLFAKILLLLGNKNYISNKGVIDKTKLIEDLFEKYHEDCLFSLGIERETLTSKFLNPQYMANFSIIYILLMCYLAGTVENFLKNKDTSSLPFGSEPWPCHNTVCPTYNKKEKPKVNCRRTFLDNTTIGSFTCNICGFKYTRKYYDGISDSDGKKYNVTNMGELWRNKVIKLYLEGSNVRKIAEILNSKHSTVARLVRNLKKTNLAYRECAPTDLPDTSLLVASVSRDKRREKYRAKIMRLKDLYPKITRVAIKKIANKEYSWLYKRDLKWLNDNIPPVRERLNFAHLDKQLQHKIKEATRSAYNSNPPSRIRKGTILRNLDLKDRNQIVSHKEKLPKTYSELESSIETIEEYQIRHVPSIYLQLKSSGYINVTVDSILAFRRSYRKCSNETKKRIEEVLEKLRTSEQKMTNNGLLERSKYLKEE